MSQTIRFMLDEPLKQWLTGRKREKDRNTNICIPREQKDLFSFLKTFFIVFEWLSFG